ncbi:helix-turn-helix transcriptional regulator [Nocardia sp. NPDC048505]|uniref:helix-turn-helix domain-containing protein n=1 Tax=unclassified Nocardia TaxID=2637762 RepID=UPI0033E6BAAE
MPNEVSPTLLRRQLGRFLRECREAKGFTILQAATAVQLSEAALQRLETGRTKNTRRQDVRELCLLYEVAAEETEKAVDLAGRAAVKSDDGITSIGGLFSDAFNMYVGMEQSAAKVVSYQEQIPGLLQTADYARGLINAFYRTGSAEDIERRVQIRLNRQVIVTRKSAPLELEVLLHESALHRVIGGPQVMARQLRELAEMSKQPNITLRVHPFSAGCTWGILHGPFVMLDFGTDGKGKPIEPPVVYVEGRLTSDLYLEKPEDVQRYHELAEAVRRTALDDMQTRKLLRDVAREYAA